MPTLLILNGHPEADGLTADLVAAYVAAAEQHAAVLRLDLRELTFDPVLRREMVQSPLEPDLERAEQALLAADHVTWLFPNWWSGPPALVKGFVDRLLRPGFAYRYRGRNQTPERLLAGRSARLISTMDSPGFWYQLVQGRPLHKAFVRGTLGFVGFAPIATTMFYEARFMPEAAREGALARVASDAVRDARTASAGCARRASAHTSLEFGGFVAAETPRAILLEGDDAGLPTKARPFGAVDG